MLESKLIQIRDVGTRIAALAFRFDPDRYVSSNEQRIVWQAGFGPASSQRNYVTLIQLNGMKCEVDPYKWPSSVRTMRVAHLLLTGVGESRAACESLGLDQERAKLFAFGRIPTGDVLDVGYVLGLNDPDKIKRFE